MPDRLKVEPMVYVIDDEASVRNALVNLLSSAGFKAEGFASPADVLSRSYRLCRCVSSST